MRRGYTPKIVRLTTEANRQEERFKTKDLLKILNSISADIRTNLEGSNSARFFMSPLGRIVDISSKLAVEEEEALELGILSDVISSFANYNEELMSPEAAALRSIAEVSRNIAMQFPGFKEFQKATLENHTPKREEQQAILDMGNAIANFSDEFIEDNVKKAVSEVISLSEEAPDSDLARLNAKNAVANVIASAIRLVANLWDDIKIESRKQAVEKLAGILISTPFVVAAHIISSSILIDLAVLTAIVTIKGRRDDQADS